MTSPVPSPSTRRWPWPLLLLALCAALAVGLASWHYFTAENTVQPLQPVTQLTPVPTTVAEVAVGLARLPVQANGYLVTQTYDVAGPFLRPGAALGLVALLGVALAYFLAAVSPLSRLYFVAAMALVIFLLMSLNADLLDVFETGRQYVLVLSLVLLVGPAYYFHAFRPETPFNTRLGTFAALVAGLGLLVFLQNPNPADYTALHLSAYFTQAGAVAFALLVLWVAFENVHGLLWVNTQAATPAGRYGLWAFLLAGGLYLTILLLYYLNQNQLLVLPGIQLDPYLLLLPAVAVAWLGQSRRAATLPAGVPPGAAATLLLVLVLLAAGTLGYALATANDPLLQAGRDFTALALLGVGGAFLLYVLLNFGPLLRQKKAVYRVVFQPQRFPFYAMYALGIVAVVGVSMRNNFFVLDQVQAGTYNNLGDLARLESELTPDDMSRALLAERYYAESDVLDQHNHKASLGRAALYRFRLQRQNEINILRRALERRPSPRISLRLAALYNEQQDFFDRLAVLQEGLQANPTNAALNADLAQLYSRSALSDSVAHYRARAAAATGSDDAMLAANELAYRIRQQDWAGAAALVQETRSSDPDNAALQANALLLARLTGKPAAAPTPLPDTTRTLNEVRFARLYHDALGRATRHDTTLLALLPALAANPANAPFLDQLTLLRAFTHHYGGQPVAAQQALLPLASGSGAGSAYYQQLQGLWLLDQGLPAPAASRLQEARENSPTLPTLPLAYALALSGQPDSARQIGARTPAGAPTRLLRAALQPELRETYSLASDSVKTQYLVLRGDELSASALLPAATSVTAGPLQATALLAQLPRALEAGQLDAVRNTLAQGAPPIGAAGASPWNVLRGELYVRGQQWPQLRELVQKGTFTGFDTYQRLYFRAALAEADKQPAEAGRLYAQLVQQAPFAENGLVAAAAFHARRNEFPAAYDVLLRGVEYNPESVALLKAYVLAAVPVGLMEYAQGPLYRLGTLLSAADYGTFRKEYDAALAARKASWN
ncbi:tetratricopeptide repeat protein [Hymenobacter lapidiphilus]|uniref:Tetratricopeptide repeat protein n=1 Tax=Hymenobacter lapidiphilus TaxID=2608003 RepID=A0A7Y7PLD9_9BACT|nr:hypothetical protein [Hymenobacter lapidiphilus]NVO29905.1 hypothetical protein [Hymenobacter lapidiphilus]